MHFRWVVVPRVIFEHVGFAADANTLAGFCEQFGLDVPDILHSFACATPYISLCVRSPCGRLLAAHIIDSARVPHMPVS